MEQETDDRWQGFLISRTHDERLLMSNEEKVAVFILNDILNSIMFC
jgi:hypothetical protein